MSALDPSMLTSRQKQAMSMLVGRKLYRNRNGYGHSPMRLTLETVGELQCLGLARIDRTSGREPFPVLTGAGMNLVGVIEMRRQRA